MGSFPVQSWTSRADEWDEELVDDTAPLRENKALPMKTKRVLILGANGMLGHCLLRSFSERQELETFATTRDRRLLSDHFTPSLIERVIGNVDAANPDSVLEALARVQPDVVINCIGVIKQLPAARNPMTSITINALFPHRLALACKAAGARLIHISTDCVFTGDQGGYTEDDPPDATDLYGRTKLLGEVEDDHCMTLRTSLIGHELRSRYGLLEWFLSQKGSVRGFTKAIYSGFPTTEIARIVADHVIPNHDLRGVYHVSSAPISKYDLLKLVATRYDRDIQVKRHEDVPCDRSLNSDLFQSVTSYRPPPWPELVDHMHNDHVDAALTPA